MKVKQIKIILIIIMMVVGSLAVYTFYAYKSYENERQITSIQIGTVVREEITQEINQVLQNIMSKADEIADTIVMKRPGKLDIENLIERETNSMPEILGVTVSYQPYMFDPSRKLFSPYFDKGQNAVIYLDTLYDYTDKTLSTSQWYTDVRDFGSTWVEPYYGQGAQAMVCDYGTPFYYTDPETNEEILAGTITMTISLNAFTKLLNGLSIGKTGYGFVISRKGNFVAHPIQEYVSTRNVLDVSRENVDGVLNRAAKMMMTQNTGYEEYVNMITGQVSYLFYDFIPNSKWSLGIVFIKNELLGSPLDLKKKLIHISFSVGIFLVLFCTLIFRLYENKERNLWILTFLISGVILINIGYIWNLTLKYYYDFEEDHYKVINNTTLTRFINIESNAAAQARREQPQIIPTGFYIQEVQFADSYNVNVSGLIWQKYSDSVLVDIEPAITFPQISPFAEALFNETILEDEYTDYNLVTWNFRGTFRLDFDYSTYPFDYRLLNILVDHPEKNHNILLVPDLEGYEFINQSMLPGVNKEITMPDSEVMSSYFSYGKKKFNTNFGYDNFNERGDIPTLHFNILLKRVFINAFVTNIIPILIVALMAYFVVFSSTKVESKKAGKAGVSSFGVVESSAAFFFVLLLAHIDLRKTVNTPIITYMESFYFIMYLILALVVFNVVMFTRKDHFLFFDFRDNLVIKLIYWPVFLLMCLTITLMNFY